MKVGTVSTSVRALRLAAFAAALLGVLFVVSFNLSHPVGLGDMAAYRGAAERLLSGGLLYPPSDPDAGSTYRYAPWFAAAWIPLTLAGGAGIVAWRLAILAAALYVTWSMLRLGGHAAVVLAALSLAQIGGVALGNVEVLIAAMLVWRKADPWSVGIAASLKIYPLLLVIGYVAERRWRDCAIAIGVAVVLWAPALIFGISGYVAVPGIANGRMGGFLWDVGLWGPVVLVLAATLATLAQRQSRWTWLVIAAAIPWLVPRYTGGPLTYVWAAARRQSVGMMVVKP